MNITLTDVTVIVVTHNSSAVIGRCLSNFKQIASQVMVCDNASRDDTLDIVREVLPEAVVIPNDRNIGYGRAINRALVGVVTEFVLILNPDAYISLENVARLVQSARGDKNAASVNPVSYESIEEMERGTGYSAKSSGTSGIGNHMTHGENENVRTDFLRLFATLVRVSVLREINNFDENIFMFFEDNIFCDRAIQRGYHHLINRRALAVHLDAASSGSDLGMVRRRHWHLKGWSMLYYNALSRGRPAAWMLFIGNLPIALMKYLFYFLVRNRYKSAKYLGAVLGLMSYMIGLGAFDRDGNPRG